MAFIREAGDKWEIAEFLHNLGERVFTRGDYDAARPYYEESLALRREVDDEVGASDTLKSLGMAASAQGDYAFARVCYEESLEFFRKVDMKDHIAILVHDQGNAAYAQGDYASARVCYEESLTIRKQGYYMNEIPSSLEALGRVAARESRMEQTVFLWATAEALRKQIFRPMSAEESEAHERDIRQARQTLSKAAFSEAWAAGAGLTLVHAAGTGMTLEQVVEQALRRP